MMLHDDDNNTFLLQEGKQQYASYVLANILPKLVQQHVSAGYICMIESIRMKYGNVKNNRQ